MRLIQIKPVKIYMFGLIGPVCVWLVFVFKSGNLKSLGHNRMSHSDDLLCMVNCESDGPLVFPHTHPHVDLIFVMEAL